MYHNSTYYGPTPSQRFLATISVLLPLMTGFYVWQVILKIGMSSPLDASSAHTALNSKLIAASLTWGSPIYAFVVCCLMMCIIWLISMAFKMSSRRRAWQFRTGALSFIGGFALSVLGIMAGIADIPPVGVLYHPLTDALSL